MYSKVTENDDKPQHICRKCEEVLKNAELLRQTAEVTQWRLQQELEMGMPICLSFSLQC